jgi:Glycosidases
VSEGARIYNFFPPLVGAVDAWKTHLPRIAEMGFNWIFLNPIHFPGFSGSLYAVKDYYALNPLFQGNSSEDPDRLIAGYLDAAARHGLKVMMDLVVNHTAKDAVLTQQHPNWYEREHDGSLRSPFALDPGNPNNKTVWADLAELDYSDRPERQEIVGYFADLVRHYTKLGFAGFRCDAAYKVPKDVWRSLISAAQKVDPDVLFIAENLGAMMEQVEALRGAGFDYLFNSAKWWDFRQGWLLEQYERFRSIAPSIAFPETHDTERLAIDLSHQGLSAPRDVERRYRNAYLFSALFSTGVMIPIGYEYGFRRKLHVVETRPSFWETPQFDISAYIGEVNKMKAAVPVLNEEGPQRAFMIGDGRICALLRRAMRGPGWAVSLINTDYGNTVSAPLNGLDGDIGQGREVTPGGRKETMQPGANMSLAPGEVRVFTRA